MPARDRAFENERVGAVLLLALVDHYSRSRTLFDFMRTLGAYKTWYTDTIDANYRIVIHANASFRALAYGLFDVTRRFFVELGLPRALLRLLKGSAERRRSAEAVFVDQGQIGHRLALEGEPLRDHLARRIEACLDAEPEFVEGRQQVAAALELHAASFVPVGYGGHRPEAHEMRRVLGILPQSAMIPRKQRHVGSQHLLRGQALRLVVAEVDHGSRAPAEIVQPLLAVEAVTQHLHAEPAAPSSAQQRLDDGRACSGCAARTTLS